MSSAESYTLGIVHWRGERQIAAVLARAFVDDPLVTAMCAAPPFQRERRMVWSFRIAVRSHCLAAQPGWTLTRPGATPVAAVLMTRPCMQPDISADLLFTVRALLHMGMVTGVRSVQAARTIAAHVPPQPFTYLRTLGVHPDLHGRGLGSRLLEQVIRSAPASLPVYLETATEKNVAFYTRHGFECIGEFGCLGVPVWRMLRPAAEPASARTIK
jgi:ribosomal protein S18 acetylase RimI-like enzyme